MPVLGDFILGCDDVGAGWRGLETWGEKREKVTREVLLMFSGQGKC